MLPDWYPANQHPAPPPEPLLDWLCHEGSLTQRLTEAGNRDFRVELLSQTPQPARVDEAQTLGLETGASVWAREVLLHTAGAPRVFARSVAPPSALGNAQVALDNLGTTSLGHLLFRNPQIRRGPIEISRYPATWLPEAWRAQGLWARRSHFSDGALQLLVCEVFLQGWPVAGT
ncbi:chorismate--pyruvate lyase family protein [Halopseudomonas maritima]|uniref:chorismate--pyruvate lyase family protein n=1 Tax=Halopseudomonas maritima TaxID=2918528 RepID=UPI001EEAD2B6|nr:chorismate lyase [Halopseudomonas maritima]UJJ29972.1 chorismate lyase [Halopseudomonas maritima]